MYICITVYIYIYISNLYIMLKNKYTTLYIQMALCEKTLQQWLDERIEVTPQEMLVAILTQTLHGLDYIHSRGIVHHDIKVKQENEKIMIQIKYLKSFYFIA